MPAQALYLKYRPQNFDQVEGQAHITRTLKNALALNRISHAYLFTGPRGTGKTSTARILAKAVNCTSTTGERPCNACVICRALNEERLLDLIEIDAASNTGVDNIRELRDKVDFRPSEARYKVYVLDEAHMLSSAAFNALLKTLEEPPPHVIFVLATTEPNKVPATITSRCQRFDFRRATLAELTEQLGKIARAEGLDIEPAALELIARQATGSFRDGASLLDQLTAYGGSTVTLAQVQGLLGAASHETVRTIVTTLAERELARGLSALGQAVDNGADPRQLARDVVEYLRGVLMAQNGGGATLNVSAETQAEMSALATQLTTATLLRAIRLFTQAAFELRGSASPTLPLEMALVESTLEPALTERVASPRSEPPPRTSAPRPEPSVDAPRAAPPTQAKKEAPPVEEKTGPVAEVADGALTVTLVRQYWADMLTRLRRTNKSTEALLRDAEPISLDKNLLTIGFFYELHKNRVESDKHAHAQIEKIFSELFATPLRIKCVLSPKKQKLKAAQDDPVIRAAMNLGAKITDISEE